LKLKADEERPSEIFKGVGLCFCTSRLAARCPVSAGVPAATLYRLLTTVQIKLDMFNLPRCTSAESFFSCCNNVAALAMANCNEHVAEENITAPAHTERSLHGAHTQGP
jgi:hypothetical protein